MRKVRLCLHVTFFSDSQTLEYYVERQDDQGRWELETEGRLSAWSERLAMFAEFQEALKDVMADGSTSMNRSSDLV